MKIMEEREVRNQSIAIAARNVNNTSKTHHRKLNKKNAFKRGRIECFKREILRHKQSTKNVDESYAANHIAAYSNSMRLPEYASEHGFAQMFCSKDESCK